MELKDLVPPLELCKQIPEGEFEDSACVHCEYSFGKANLIVSGKEQLSTLVSERDRLNFIEPPSVCNVYPAPTVEEILKEVAVLSGTYATASVWADGNAESSYLDYELDVSRPRDTYESVSEAALRLWFKVKGISVSDESHDK